MANEDKLFSFFLTERSQVSSPGLQGNSAPLSHSGNLILSVLILCHLWQQWSLQGDPTSITWELVMFSSDAGRVRLGNVLPLPGLSIKNLHTFSLWGTGTWKCLQSNFDHTEKNDALKSPKIPWILYQADSLPLNHLGSPANSGDAGDWGSILGLGGSPGGGHGNLLQYFCLGNPMDRGAWRPTVHGVSTEHACRMSQPQTRTMTQAAEWPVQMGTGELQKLQESCQGK